MKVIDLLNKIANGEEVPNKIRIDHWCYEFEWVEHLENYYDKSADLDLMSALSMSKEELNYEVKIIEEDKSIEKIKDVDEFWFQNPDDELQNQINTNQHNTVILKRKINELVDKVNELEEGKK